MASVSKKNGNFSLRAYQGDAKTLLAFNLPKADAKDLAGFTIQCTPKGKAPYYVFNQLQFRNPGDHAQVASEPPRSSINAPIHYFRWLHVPGSNHQGLKPLMGEYQYTVTPRYFDAQHHLTALDQSVSASVKIDVVPFEKGALSLGFTRGYTQSQAFVHHFGKNARFRPKGNQLIFDTSQQSGVDPHGSPYTYADEYDWLGYTARERIFTLLNEVLAKKSLRLDMFAYDLNEPDLMEIVLKLARQGRVRVILDNAGLHHGSPPKPEDRFETEFNNAAKGSAAILRGKFKRYAHDKIFIVSRGNSAVKVLTGSTNFSVTGLYVNSNHVIQFDDPKVADVYAKVFEQAWTDKTSQPKFQASQWATQVFSFKSGSVPETDITFSPHDQANVDKVLGTVVARIAQEGKKGKNTGNVLFAVMQVDNGTGPIFPALRDLHADQSIFSYGITDTTKGIRLYEPGKATGVLVTGKPGKTMLPKPFDQVPGVGLGHQVHHKFVVCGFNRPDAVVFCGSSNLASGGEKENGDNLLAIYDEDVATAFAVEAVGLVDHFSFLDRYSGPGGEKKKPSAIPAAAAVAAEWFLSTTDRWTRPYFDPEDLKCADRRLFA